MRSWSGRKVRGRAMRIVNTRYYSGSGQIGVDVEGVGEILLDQIGAEPRDDTGRMTQEQMIAFHCLQNRVTEFAAKMSIPLDEAERLISRYLDTLV